MKYLWDHEPKLKKVFSPEGKKIIFLDFDGTLVPIAPTPGEVRLDPEIKKLLQKLSQNKNCLLVFISGRPLKELHDHLGLKNVVLAGNHGLEIRGRGLRLPLKARQARKLRHFIGVMSQKFKAAFNFYPGVLVEDKKFTLSIHFRNLPADQGVIFRELIRFFRQKYGNYPIVWTEGKKVVEIRPSIYWGKGDTVAYLMKKNRGCLALAVGDDKTDEDMFRMLKGRGGVTIHVGNSKSSLADYYLNSPADVKELLKKVC